MCRLPIELMALIIKFSRNPLPFVPDEEAPIPSTWKDVCQPELATFMRVSKMTYLITAPLLYKEAVIGSLESFFYGFDASHKVIKHGLSHPLQHHSGDDQIANIGLDNLTIDSIHKRALLKLVTAVHIVHNPKDGSMYRDTQAVKVNDLDDIFDDLVQKVDVSRHTNIPKSVKDSAPAQILPNLQRATVGLWCRDGLDDSDPFCPLPPHSNDAIYDYHCHVASEMYQFTPGTVCRTPWDGGFLNVYPVVWGDIRTNILHEADLGAYGHLLVPDAKNYVHIDIDAQSYGFTQYIFIRYKYMVQAMALWPDQQKISNLELQGTEVTFVVHHPFKREYDKGEEAMRRWYRSIKDYETELRAYITNHDPYPEERALLDGWDNWKIIPEEEYPFCPACQPEEYRNHQNSKTIASPSSS